jgi:hypothetical protein
MDLLQHHEKLIFPIMKKRYLFANADNFLLYDFWSGNIVNEDVFAYSNRVNNEHSLIIYHNKYAETKGFIKNSVGFAVKHKDDKVQTQKSLAEGLKLPNEGYCIFKDYLTGLEYIRRNRDLHDQGLYLELHAFQCFLFMDFQIVNDNEFFHYAQLYDLLGGKGVHGINETLHEIIYQPLLDSFKKIVNTHNFKNLLDSQKTESIGEDISKKLNTFLLEVKKYSSSKKDVVIIDKVIQSKLRATLQLHQGLLQIDLPPNLRKIFILLLPKSEFEWGILFSWLFIHQLGRVTSEENYELQSRSWFDEWRLSKYIKNTLRELSINEEEKTMEVGSIIKLIVSLHNWSNSMEYREKNFYSIFQSFFRDPEIQLYLKVNRYHNLLWYSAEKFDDFTRWIWLTAIIDRIAKSNDTLSNEIEELLAYFHRITEIAKNSKFQVNKFLEDLQNMA